MSAFLNETFFGPFEDKMKKTCSVLQESLNGIRAGRANPKVLDHIRVSYYGTDTALNQLANIQVPEPRSIVITPWDASCLKDMEKAIQASDLGINPANDGKCIRLVFPVLTEERRKTLVKQVQKYGEESKIAIRNIRREMLDAAKKMEKKAEISEDSLKEAEEKIQKITDKFVKDIDTIIKAKEKDLMEI